MKDNAQIGIIGGSGLYEMATLEDVSIIDLDTPFGAPSDAYIVGSLQGVKVAFLPRHGRGHRISPSELNFRANIYGFKKLGVERILSVTAVGSLREEIQPLDIVIPDQYYDRTRERDHTFFGDGLVAHVAFADPVCPDLAGQIYRGATDCGARIHQGGTMVCIEGPAFSTRAESRVYRQWSMDLIGMTTLQEAKLAREAEICYATIALVTDYDCWHQDNAAVTVETVVQNLEKNSSTAKKIIQAVVPKIPATRSCGCGSALQNAIMTDPAVILEKTRQKLDLLVRKYLKS